MGHLLLTGHMPASAINFAVYMDVLVISTLHIKLIKYSTGIYEFKLYVF
jgi:hypothetical protein